MNKTETLRAAAGMIVGVMILMMFQPYIMPPTSCSVPQEPYNFLPSIILIIGVAFIVLIILYVYSRIPEKEKDLTKNE